MTDTATAPRICALCGASGATTYGLRTQERVGGRPRSSGAGSIRLCASCWQREAAPSMRAQQREDRAIEDQAAGR